MSAMHSGGLAPGPFQFPIAARQSEICICVSCLVSLLSIVAIWTKMQAPTCMFCAHGHEKRTTLLSDCELPSHYDTFLC